MKTTKFSHGFGYWPDLIDHNDDGYAYAAAPEMLAAPLPEVISLRSGFPGVYDQGRLGSCVFNGLTMMYRYTLIKEGLADLLLSRLFPYYNTRAIEHTVVVDVGASPRDALKTYTHKGDCLETEWPYDVSRFAVKPPMTCYNDALHHKLISYHRIYKWNGLIQNIRACLAEGYPVGFGIPVFESFPENGSGDIPLPQPGEQQMGGHFMVIGGEDHPVNISNVLNSWGPDWGDGGWGTIPDTYLEKFGMDFWTIRLVR
jgi:C1A family cysteine protease